MKRLALASPEARDSGADALRTLAVALAPHLRELLAAERRGGELVDVAEVVPLPRRAVYRACRAGRIAGATRVARRWLATREAVEAWLRAAGPRAVPNPEADDEDELEPLRRSLSRDGRCRTG